MGITPGAGERDRVPEPILTDQRKISAALQLCFAGNAYHGLTGQQTAP